jgi:uncharacterized protein with HEPN domain
MMQKDDLIFVGHMLDMAHKAIEKIRTKDRLEFDQDENLHITLLHLVQVIGEAARRVSPAFREVHPEIPWTKIVGMRHRVVHDYMHVDYEAVWEVVTINLPPLITQLEKLVPKDR